MRMIHDHARRGAALLFALVLMLVGAGMITLITARTVGELRNSADDAGIVQALMVARAGASLSGSLLNTAGPVRDRLEQIVTDTAAANGLWAYGEAQNGADEPEYSSVIDDIGDGDDSALERFQDELDDLMCNGPVFASDVGTATVRIHVTATACGEALPASVTLPATRFVAGTGGGGGAFDQTYAIPYILISVGEVGSYRRNVVLSGEYRVTLGQPSFARYALFTNIHESSSGSTVWFTDRTRFDGPVHTNQYFRYYRTPEFGGAVSSAGCSSPGTDSCSGSFDKRGADFYGQGFVAGASMAPNSTSPSYTNGYGTHAPDFGDGVDWGANFIPLPGNNHDQAALAANAGIFFSNGPNDLDLDDLVLFAGDGDMTPSQPDGNGGHTPEAGFQYVYADVKGDEDVLFMIPGPGAVGTAIDSGPFGDDDGYTIQASDVGKVFRSERGDDGSFEDWDVHNGGADFNGVIYVDDDIKRLSGPDRTPRNSADPLDAPPAVAAFLGGISGGITVTAGEEITITGDLVYERPGATCASIEACREPAHEAALGVFTPGGDIVLGNNNGDDSENAPYDVAIQAVLMASRGEVTVEDYWTGLPRGDVHLLGGIIEYTYGAFGRFDPSTGSSVHGYGRAFDYDERMLAGVAPPAFPSLTARGVDSVRTLGYGQREQLY